MLWQAATDQIAQRFQGLLSAAEAAANFNSVSADDPAARAAVRPPIRAGLAEQELPGRATTEGQPPLYRRAPQQQAVVVLGQREEVPRPRPTVCLDLAERDLMVQILITGSSQRAALVGPAAVQEIPSAQQALGQGLAGLLEPQVDRQVPTQVQAAAEAGQIM
jgi:hypothetical protein